MLRLSLLFLLICLGSCYPVIEESGANDTGEVEGYVPIYGEPESSTITLSESRVIKNPGKIYVYGKYLLINEVNQGIHIYNNEDPADPTPVGFAELIGNTNMAIRNNILYADHMGSLVALNTNDFAELVEVGRLPLANWLLGVPPPSQHYFECVDASKGLVIGWEKQVLLNPDCYAL